MYLYSQRSISTERGSVDAVELAHGNLEGRQRPIDQGGTAVQRMSAHLHGRCICYTKTDQHTGSNRMRITRIEAQANRRRQSRVLRSKTEQRSRWLNERCRHFICP